MAVELWSRNINCSLSGRSFSFAFHTAVKHIIFSPSFSCFTVCCLCLINNGLLTKAFLFFFQHSFVLITILHMCANNSHSQRGYWFDLASWCYIASERLWLVTWLSQCALCSGHVCVLGRDGEPWLAQRWCLIEWTWFNAASLMSLNI